MPLFAAWTSVVLGAARIDPPAAAAPEVPEPRRFRLAHNPVPVAIPAIIPSTAPASRPVPVAAPAPVSTRRPPVLPARLCLEK
ncbi:hypothetical protein [Azospirillum sp. B510]|uniref:hypothetical protein n=1 Tax=Azospirillum sp. (strain B510) TaxID=137722 RepID=UPI0002E3599A|nr:hypothetical protein [Azospirillum sp. B510]